MALGIRWRTVAMHEGNLDELPPGAQKLSKRLSAVTDVVPALGNGEDCVICLSPMDEECVATPCGHHFHQACLDQYLLVNNELQEFDYRAPRARCPVCRGSMRLPQAIEVTASSGLRIEVVAVPEIGGLCHFDRGYRFMSLGSFQRPGMFYVRTSNEDRHTPDFETMWTVEVAVPSTVYLNFRSEAHVSETGAAAWLRAGGWKRNRGMQSTISNGIPNGPYSGPIYSKHCQPGKVELKGSNTWEGVYFVFVEVETWLSESEELPPTPEETLRACLVTLSSARDELATLRDLTLEELATLSSTREGLDDDRLAAETVQRLADTALHEAPNGMLGSLPSTRMANPELVPPRPTVAAASTPRRALRPEAMVAADDEEASPRQHQTSPQQGYQYRSLQPVRHMFQEPISGIVASIGDSWSTLQQFGIPEVNLPLPPPAPTPPTPRPSANVGPRPAHQQPQQRRSGASREDHRAVDGLSQVRQVPRVMTSQVAPATGTTLPMPTAARALAGGHSVQASAAPRQPSIQNCPTLATRIGTRIYNQGYPSSSLAPTTASAPVFQRASSGALQPQQARVHEASEVRGHGQSQRWRILRRVR